MAHIFIVRPKSASVAPSAMPQSSDAVRVALLALASLIGAALTERLLKPAAQPPPNGPTSMDTPP